jgi:hypothetical protein
MFLVPMRSLRAQSRQEIGVAIGAGALLVNGNHNASPVGGIAYRLHVTDRFAAEGALDFFTYTFPVGPVDRPSVYRDGYSGAEAAVIYHFRASRAERKWIPFAAVGLGRTTTDFTEIRGATYYRFGLGLSYNFSERFGARWEIRDEAIRDLYSSGRSLTHLPSARVGIVVRF